MIGKKMLVAVVLAATALVALPLAPAQAQVSVGVGIGYPGYRHYYRRPYYRYPRVWVAPSVVIAPAPPPVVVVPAPQPVYTTPAPVYVQPVTPAPRVIVAPPS
jgi:hypothetical protein